MNTFELDCGHLATSDIALEVGDSIKCPVTDTIERVAKRASKPPVSTVVNGAAPERSYGCSWGCGNAYDYIIISVADGTTEFLDLVCMLKLMQDMIMAVIQPDDPAVRDAMADMSKVTLAPMTEGKVRRRGKNAPATAEDDELIEAFDSRITPDELGDEFK